MPRVGVSLVRFCLPALVGILACSAPVHAQLQLFHDRATFEAALAGLPPPLVDDYESYALGDIPFGDRRGDFLYSFDPALTQPAVVPGGDGGQALGGSPFDVFVGGDSVTLAYRPLPAGRPPLLRAFGADFLYAPSFDTIPADTYRLSVGDGNAAGQFAGNLDGLDGAGGGFFLGIIATPSAAFTQVSLSSAGLDPAFLVPAYQGDNLIYVAVPEPSPFVLFALGGAVAFIGACRRRHRRCPG